MDNRTLTASQVRDVLYAFGGCRQEEENERRLSERFEISRRALKNYKKDGTRKGAANVLLRGLAIQHGIIPASPTEVKS